MVQKKKFELNKLLIDFDNIPNELTKYIVYSMIIGWVLVTLPSLKNI